MRWNSIFMILVPVVLILGSGRMIVFNTTLQNPLLDYANASGINNEVANYLHGKKAALDVAVFTDLEKAHMADVKAFIKTLAYVLYTALVLLAIAIIYLLRNDKEILINGLFYGGITTLVLMILMLAAVFFDFSIAFDWFHRIFFPQGNYIFDTELTKLYTQHFFNQLALRWFGMTAIFAGLLVANRWRGYT